MANRKSTKSAAPKVSKASKRAPGNATALRAKASDNVKALRAKSTASDDCITTVKSTSDGGFVYVAARNGDNFARPNAGDSKAFRDLAAVGKSYSAARDWHIANPATKPQAQMARGTDARTAPHSAKAVADERAANSKSKAAAPTENKGKVRTAKAAKGKQPTRGTNRAYVAGTKKDESKPDTFRKYMLTTILKHKDTDSAKAAHAKSGKYPTHKLDFNWSAQQGYIKFSK